MLPTIFASYDLTGLGILAAEQIEMMRSKALRLAVPAVLRGGSSTSLEGEDFELDYSLVTGRAITTELPELDALYRGVALKLANRISPCALVTSGNERSAVNINIIHNRGARYEWHYDSNPMTGILYLTSTNPARGGELLFRSELTADITSLTFAAGQLFIFDGRQAHGVNQLLDDGPRVCAVMNFYIEGEEPYRPTDLDAALYGA